MGFLSTNLRNVFEENTTQPQKYPESMGYYERIPIQVDEFVLITNEKGLIVFETTDHEICKHCLKLSVKISTDPNGWSTICTNGSTEWEITPSVDVSSQKLARHRAMWHAAQYMAGRDLSYVERFSLIYQGSFSTDPNLCEDDAFFDNGSPVTNDPFGEFIKE